MGTYEVEFYEKASELVEHVKRVELEGTRFYFICKTGYVLFDRVTVKSFGLISFDEE